MLACALVLLLLLLASYTDLRTRRIPNAVTYPFILAGLLLLPSVPLQSVLAAFIGVALSYALYRLGVWAGGDAKLFFAVSLLLPHPFMGIPAYLWLIALSVVVGGCSALLYVLWRVLTSERRREFAAHMLRASVRAFALAVFLKSFGPLGIVSALLPAPPAFFGALALLLVFRDVGFVPIWLGVLAVCAVCYLLSLRSWAFSRVVPANRLAEGDVPAEFVTRSGEKMPVTPSTVALYFLGKIEAVADPLKARGLTAEEIAALRELGVERIRVKSTVPFVPFVLAAHLLLMIFSPFCT